MKNTYNKSEILKAAWKAFRSSDVTFSQALIQAWRDAKNPSYRIQKTKSFILSYAFQYGWNKASVRDMADEAETIVDLVSKYGEGLAKEIATTVNKYKKVSEKQAYWIAKYAVENNHVSRIDFIF